MDWKYKHFYQERVFAAPRDLVIEAARNLMTKTLGWQATETPEGFTATGYSFSHAAIGNIRIESNAAGTKLAIDLRVERAGSLGFMLFDVGGYYTIQIRKWLDGIQLAIHQKLNGSGEQDPNPISVETNKNATRVFHGCLMFIVAMFALWILVTLIFAVAGLLSGTLYLWGRGGTVVLHGGLARIVSSLILIFAAFIGWRVKRKT
jgi:hypothetical protein